jgi:hypothetical protein
MKQILLIMFIFTTFGAYADEYCNAVTNNQDEYISNIQFGDIDNSSDWNSDVTIYNDTTDINIDTDYGITVTVGNPYRIDSVSVWIDIDNSETFDEDERVRLWQLDSTGIFIDTINISSTSDYQNGTTRMRVRLTYGTTPEPCDSSAWGETEDYYVNLVEMSSSDVYCAASSSNDDEYIANVRFGEINNTSSWEDEVTVYEQYADFELDKSQFIIVEVADYFDSYDSVTVWIDFDHSGTFDNDEKYNLYVWGYKNYNKFFTGNLFLSSSSDFEYGTTRMRVRLTNDVTPDPCGTFDHGETEDYFVDIIDAGDSYCNPVILWDDISISNVGFSNIDNSTDWDFKVNIYNDEVADIKLDTNYIITVTVDNYESGDSVVVWVDIDQSETFDSDESILLSYIGGGVFQGSINISSSSEFAYGETRMRVKLARGNIPSSCYNYSKGETEDYFVNIIDSSSDDYCEASTTNDGEFIASVRFIDIYNTSFWDSEATIYNQVTDLELNRFYYLIVEVGEPDDMDSVSVWIDYDQNGTYDNNEQFTCSFWGYHSSNQVYIANISIFNFYDFVYGETRMRVRLARDINPEPCGTSDYGETEDYLVNIIDREDNYCNKYNHVSQIYISSVEFGGISNESEWEHAATLYNDTTDIDTDTDYVISVVADSFNDNEDSISVWIDYDHSETFDMDEEYKLFYVGNDEYQDTIRISSSSDFIPGLTRMRINLAYGETPNPCGLSSYGETEDYYVNIPDDYCNAVTEYEDEYISAVWMQGIINSSEWQSNVEIYNQVATMNVNSDYIVTVGAGNYYNGDSVSIWIDYDHSDTYDDDEEYRIKFKGVDIFQDTINIPSNSDFEYGLTRMRVRLTYNTTPEPCGTLSYGETEDYFVDIQYSASIDIAKEVQVTMYMDGQWDGTSHAPIPVSGEIRSGDDLMSSTLVSRVAAIVGSNGVVSFNFEEVDDGDYWLVVRAGGYLPLGSTSKVSVSTSASSYNFTDADTKAAGGDRALKESNGIYLLRTGDLNFDRRVSAGDVPYISDPYGKNLRPYVPEP